MEGKGLKRHLTDSSSSSKGSRRSSSPCSDTDVQLLSSKRKFCDINFSKSNQKDEKTRSNVCSLSPQPTRYLTTKRHSQELCSSPKIAIKGDEWELLSCDVWSKYLSVRQSDEKYTCKMRLHDVLHQMLRLHFPTCSLFVVGSSMNGFGCNSSDIDMCLVLQPNDMDQTVDAINVLKHIQKILNRCDFVQKVELIRAKVPILKFKDSVSGCEVDLNVNNTVGIRNTHLLHQYSKTDWRVRPLILIIKMWARAHDINDAKNMTVSSYSLTLMVIHYLQVGVSPPVLPCLHKLLPKIFTSDSDVKCLRLEENLYCSPSENNQSLGQLLVGFLNYFSSFPFGEQAISVRLGQRISKYNCQYQRSRKNNPGQWKCLSIEEPFDLTNTARSVYDYDVFARIEEVFRSSHRKLLMSRNLKSILLQ
ncbi:hypothetical protein CHUAL_002519 [Chamberlinius hualienensis]